MTLFEQSQSLEANYEKKQQDEKLLFELGLSQKEIDELKSPDITGSTSLVSFIDRVDKKLVIKKGINVDLDLNARREYTFLRLLKMRKGEKIAPEPYFYASDPESDLLIMERIEGQEVKELSDEDLIKIAQAMATVHKPEFKKPGIPFHYREKASQYDRLIEQIDFLRDWFDELSPYINDVNLSEEFNLNQLIEAKDIILDTALNNRDNFKDSSFSLIHYDFNPGNILKDNNGKILFLDWRQASIGDRGMDVAKLFYKNYLDEYQQEIFFTTYLVEINDDTLRERVNAYSPLIRLSSLLWRLRFLNIDLKEHPEIENGVDVEMVQARLTDDYQYLINESGIKINK